MDQMKVACLAWLVGLVGLAGSAFAQAIPAAAADAPRPNVIFVLVDDLGYGGVGCFGDGRVNTPNIDRLAAEGIKFTRFHVNSPICSPSRVAFTTGQHPSRWRITSYIDNRGANERRGMAQWLDPAAPSLARMLQSAGYRTAHVGKWHMGGGRDVGEAPLITEYGFDVSLTQFEGMGDRVLPTFDTLFPNQEHNAHPLANRSAELGRGDIEFVKRYEINRRYVDRAIDFIKDAQKRNAPFYLNLWTDDPHTPLEASPGNRGDGTTMPMYKGVMEEMDRDLGLLFDLVRNDPKLRQNTVIVWASDNGHDPAVDPAHNLRGHKGTLYQGGIRTPMIVWWPGGQQPQRIGGSNDSTVVAGFDLVPTVLNITNVSAPADVQFDGQNMVDAFRGGDRPRSGPLFWMRPPDRPGPKENDFPDLAIRLEQWKLLMDEGGTDEELFNLDADPTESNDLAKEQPKIVEDLKSQLLAWRKQMPQPIDRQP